MTNVITPNNNIQSPLSCKMITLIAAVAQNGAIGFNNKLLYWLPNDLKRFKALTTGHTVIMGRKTFESLPKGALPNRRNIVLSRNCQFIAENAEIFTSLSAALHSCSKEEDVFIIGGASVYAEAMAVAQRLCLTIVEDTPSNADAFFPAINTDEWEITNKERYEADEKHANAYSFVDYSRIDKA